MFHKLTISQSVLHVLFLKFIHPCLLAYLLSHLYLLLINVLSGCFYLAAVPTIDLFTDTAAILN